MGDDTNRPHVPDVFSWEMVRKALKAAEEGVYCWNVGTHNIFYTEQCLRMMGLPFHEIAPNIFTESERTIHEEDRNFFNSEIQKYLARNTKTPMRVEVRLLNQRSRGWKWVRVNGLVERDENNKVTRLVGVWVDITRRKMADLHAMEDRDLFRTLINLLPDNIYFKNRESRFVIANDATAKKMKVPTPSDLIGSTDRHFFDAEMADVSRQNELEVMTTGKPVTSKLYAETWHDGHKSWCKISKFPWYGADKKVKGIVGISSDVTDIVEGRQRYQRMAEQLDQRNKAYEKEISLAREIQRALQPLSIPERRWQVPEGHTRMAQFHHIYRPSTGVAGDCFEVFRVGESGVGMLICDVMGHGVRAALIASVLRGLMEQVSGLADTPGLLLSSLNRQLFSIFSKANLTMFASAFYVYLDLAKKRLTLSGAGHPAPIVISAEGHPYLPALPRSPALGLIDTALYRESEIVLEPGMKLMLYTDGLTEARNPAGDELGAVRMMDYMRQNPPSSIRDMLELALASMMEFSQSEEQDDDICMLGVEFSELE